MTVVKSIILVILASFVSSSSVSAKPRDPCSDQDSNAGMRESYSKQQARVTAETDLLASRITAYFRKEAEKSQGDESQGGPVVSDILRKAASTVTQSQETWKAYRDQHCNAVAYTWTTGSGAGTAYESCLFDLGQERLRELRSAFKG